jgi:Na+-translocating ferredoxin:NAD+ oxidoreductase RnfD subunit
MRFFRTPKGLVLLAWAPLVALAALEEATPWERLVLHMLTAVVVACALDAPYLRVETGRWQAPTSALLTGLIVGIILAPGTPLEVVAVASLVSILSKRLIRIGRDHLFNPAVVGLLWVGWQFGSGESWWGALANTSVLWLPVLLIPGVLIAHRLNKLPLVLMFSGVYVALWTAGSYLPLVQTQTAAEMFRPPFLQAGLFFALYMLTDPPTSPNLYPQQLWFGAVAAVGAFVATLSGAGQLYLLAALLGANGWLAAERIGNRRGGRRMQTQDVDRARGAEVMQRAQSFMERGIVTIEAR